MSGDQKCRSIRISPELLKRADADGLQQIILTAINKALDESRELAARSLGPLGAA